MRRISDHALALPRPAKRAIAVIVDVLTCVLSVHVAYYLRTNDWPDAFGASLYPALASILLAVPIFVICGLYRAIFRYGGTAALLAILRAVFIYSLPFTFFFTTVGVAGVPRTIGLLQPILLLLFVSGTRSLASGWFGRSYRNAVADADKPRILIYGAGSSGRQVASALQMSGQVRVLGFLDDDRTLWRAVIHGLQVHAPAQLPTLIHRHKITDVLLAINETSRGRRNEIIAQLKHPGLRIRAMPGVDQLARGTVSFSDLRDLDIEDLLGRAPVPPDEGLLRRNITGHVVMVTGAGGSIGSEISRQISRLAADVLLLVDSSEFALYAIHQELLEAMQNGSATVRSIVPLLATVRDERRIDEIIATWQPYTIYHAAAYKHVPLVEHNVLEGIANNVFGTLNVTLAARAHGVANLVLISTDKAVRPANVMGATKRLAEIILQAIQADGAGGLFSMVRFGNVLGSSGSVVPLFRAQIAAGGPVTITHPDITRYFMTIPEAAQLVIQAGAMAAGGDVFVLDMGEPVRIVDLARTMIELSGLRVSEDGDEAGGGLGDIAITTIGLRPGEKLYEELLIGNDPSPSAHPRILRAHEPLIPWPTLAVALDRLRAMIARGDANGAYELLGELVPEFEHMGEFVDHVALRLDGIVQGN